MARRVSELKAAGIERFSAFTSIVQANQLLSENDRLADGELLALIAHAYPPSSGVTQETQETEDNQRTSTKLNERHRGPAKGEGKANQASLQAKSKAAQTAQVRPSLHSWFHAAIEIACAHNATSEKWQSPLFLLVRMAKGFDVFQSKKPHDVFAALDAIIQKWGQGEDGWSRYFKVSREDAQTEFLDAWDKVRYIPGRDPLRNAWDLAQTHGVQLRDEVQRRRSEGYPLFIALAGWLQVVNGDNALLLPVQQVAELLKVSKMTVSRYRKWAQEDGYLHLTGEHRFAGPNRDDNKATEFRFDIGLFEMFRLIAKKGISEVTTGGAGAVAVER